MDRLVVCYEKVSDNDSGFKPSFIPGFCERRLDFSSEGASVDAVPKEEPAELEAMLLSDPEEEMAIIDQLEEYERQEKTLGEDAELEQQVRY